MSRERVVQALGWLGLVWIGFIIWFYLFQGDGSIVLNNILYSLGWR
jgi:hypothetical protein